MVSPESNCNEMTSLIKYWSTFIISICPLNNRPTKKTNNKSISNTLYILKTDLVIAEFVSTTI